MKVSVKDSAPCEKLLSVAVTGERIREEYDHFFEHIAKEARVPGFRPGRAPQEVLRARFRDEAREKVLERLISNSLREAIGEKQLEFLGRPVIQGVEFTEEKLSYEAVLEVPPNIKNLNHRGLSAQRPAVTVGSAEVDEMLERVRESVAKFVAVEDRPAGMGDFLIADYQCLIEGKEVEKRSDDWIELREKEFLNGFSAQLVGVRPGEERQVKINFPADFGRKEWAGKEAVFQVKVKEVKAKKLPPLTDELAKETGEFETLANLRSHLENQLREKKTREAEVQYENDLFEALLKGNSFQVPPKVVERRLAALAESAIHSLEGQGLPREAAEKELQAIYDKLRPEAERQVRLSFLLDEVVKREKLELGDTDFEIKYKEIAARHRQSEESVRKFYAEHPEAKQSLALQILNEKAVRVIKENAK